MQEKKLKYLDELLQEYSALTPLRADMLKAIELLHNCILNKGTIYLCGNGGSAADAEHIVGELMKSFMKKRPIQEEKQASIQAVCPTEKAQYLINNLEEGIRAISLVSGVALPTAFANDVTADMIFAQQIYTLANENDILWALSTSGNSQNVINALYVARAKKVKTLGFTGRDGGKMAELLDVEIRAPHNSTPRIQEMHLPLYHCLCASLEELLF